jgi:hypothetical protein
MWQQVFQKMLNVPGDQMALVEDNRASAVLLPLLLLLLLLLKLLSFRLRLLLLLWRMLLLPVRSSSDLILRGDRFVQRSRGPVPSPPSEQKNSGL